MAQPTTASVGIKWGILLGLAMTVLSFGAYYSGLQDINDPSSKGSIITIILTYAVLILFFFLGVKAFKSSNSGLLSLGEGLTTSLFIGLISGIISVITTYIFMVYVAPDFADTMAENAMQNQDREMDEKEAEMMGNVMNTVMSPGVMAVTNFVMRLFSALIFGFIASLILRNED